MEKARYSPGEIENFLDNLLTINGIERLAKDETGSILEKFLLSEKKSYGLFRDESLKTRIVYDYLKAPDEFFSKIESGNGYKRARKLFDNKLIEKSLSEYEDLFSEFRPNLEKVSSHQNLREFLVFDEIYDTLKEFLIGKPIINLSSIKNTLLGACRFVSENPWIDSKNRLYYISQMDFSTIPLDDFFNSFGEHLRYLGYYKNDLSKVKNLFSLINKEILAFPTKINLNYALWLVDFNLEENIRDTLREEIVTKSKIEALSRQYEFVKSLIGKINSLCDADSLGLTSFFGNNYEVVSNILSPIKHNGLKEAYSNSRRIALDKMEGYNKSEVDKVRSALRQAHYVSELECIAKSIAMNLSENYKLFGQDNAQELKKISTTLLDQKEAKLKSDESKIKELDEMKARIGYNFKSIYNPHLSLSQNIAKEKEVACGISELCKLLSYFKESDNELLKSEISDYTNSVIDLTNKCTNAVFDEENKLLTGIERIKNKRTYEGSFHQSSEELKNLKYNLKLLRGIKKEHEKDAKGIFDSIKKSLGSEEPWCPTKSR